MIHTGFLQHDIARLFIFLLFLEGSSNPVVASQAVKPGTDSEAIENFVAMATEEGSLGGIFQDLPMDLTEADYLDSFMDLSNFLTPVSSHFCHDRVLDLSILKLYVDNKNYIQRTKKILPSYRIEKLENMTLKGGNAGCPLCVLFPKCFYKVLSSTQ